MRLLESYNVHERYLVQPFYFVTVLFVNTVNIDPLMIEVLDMSSWYTAYKMKKSLMENIIFCAVIIPGFKF